MAKKKPQRSLPVNDYNNALNNFDQWAFYGFLAIAITLPLAMSRITYDQFDIAKILSLRVFTLVTLLFWVWKMLVSKKQELRWSYVDFAVAGFLLLVFISTVTSIHFPTALHGKFKRYEGFLTFLNYGILYFLALQIFTSFERLSTLSKVLTFTGGIVAFYGVLQYMGLDPFPWATLPFEERRSFSTFGNPDLLGGFLVILLPIAAAEFLRAKGKNNILMFGILSLTLMSLLWAYMRGAWIAAAVAGLVFIALGAREVITRWRKIFLVVGAFASVFAITAILSVTIGHNVINLIERLKSITHITQGSAASRIEIWKAGLQAIQEKPILGWGPDTFRFVSERFETLKYVQIGQGRTVADNAHNYLVQLATGVGIPATIILIAAFLAIIFIAIRYTWKMQGDEKLVYIGFISAAIGYLVHLLFGVSISGSTGVFWLIIGALLAAAPIVKTVEINRASSITSFKAAMAILTIVSIMSTYYALSMYAGDYNYARAIRQGNEGNLEQAVLSYERAISLYNSGRYYDGYGMMLERAGIAGQDKELISRAVSIYELAVMMEPNEADHYVFLAGAKARLATNAGDPMLESAATTLRNAIEVRPNAYSARLLLGNILVFQDKYEEALDYLNFAEKVKPNDKVTILMLAKCYDGLGHKEEARKYYEKLLQIEPDNEEAKQALERLRP